MLKLLVFSSLMTSTLGFTQTVVTDITPTKSNCSFRGKTINFFSENSDALNLSNSVSIPTGYLITDNPTQKILDNSKFAANVLDSKASLKNNNKLKVDFANLIRSEKAVAKYFLTDFNPFTKKEDQENFKNCLTAINLMGKYPGIVKSKFKDVAKRPCTYLSFDNQACAEGASFPSTHSFVAYTVAGTFKKFSEKFPKIMSASEADLLFNQANYIAHSRVFIHDHWLLDIQTAQALSNEILKTSAVEIPN